MRYFVNYIKSKIKKNKPFLYSIDFAIPEWLVGYEHAAREIEQGGQLPLPQRAM